MPHIDDDNLPGEQGLPEQQGGSAPPQTRLDILALAAANAAPARAQPIPPVPHQPTAPRPEPTLSTRRTRCYPCYRVRRTCDRQTRTAAAQANGIDTTVHPVCCSNCERKVARQPGFLAGFCAVDPDVSRAAGLQGCLDAWHAKHG